MALAGKVQEVYSKSRRMHKRILAALLLVSLAGCLDSPQEDSDGPDAVLGEQTGIQSFYGDAEFGAMNALVGTNGPAASADTIYLGRYAPEPNIGATANGDLFMTAFSSTMRSKDQGDTWEVVHTHDPLLNNDPMLWVDTVTDRVYSAPMFPTLLCSSVYWSDDAGDSWTPNPTPACGTGAFDHQKFATALPGPGTNPLAGVLHETVAYLCYNGIAITNCMASYDGGQTWPVDVPTAVNVVDLAASLFGIENVPVDLVSPCFSGQNGHPTGGPDGTIAFLRTWSCRQPILTYSTDSGLTWNNVPGPQYPGGPSDFLTTANAHSIDPEVAFTPDGTMYVLFQSHDHHAYVARTSNLGATWEGPWDVTPPGMNSTVFAALSAGSDGRIAMGFLASNATGSSTNVPQDTRWQMFHVFTETADQDQPLWYAVQATEDPVQVGPILQGGGTDNTRNLLDFIDSAVDPEGNFYVAFTVGCSTSNGCTDLPAEEQTSGYRASDGAIARLHGFNLWG